MTHKVGIVGTGYVADLYMRSIESFPEIDIVFTYDIKDNHLERFCNFWQTPKASSLKELLQRDDLDLVLNLTNPDAHYIVSKQCLEAGKHVYSEKPLALDMGQAYELHRIASEKNLMIGSAPCSFLSETAQTIRYALETQNIGKPYLIYAELDDDFIPQAPYKKWFSESGAPWPYEDEFKVGCTLEHAGYYLTWLMAIFGSVKKVVAASANLIENKLPQGNTAPDYSTAMLFFESGIVARITCSVVAPHDHQMRIFCENGILQVDECWDNSAKVLFKRRFTLRRRLINSPFSKTIKLPGPAHTKVKRRGAAKMNFALGPKDMLEAIKQGKPSRVSADFALHLNEVTLAIQNSGSDTGVQIMKTKMPFVEPMPWSDLPGKNSAF